MIILDDEMDIREMLGLLMKKFGFSVSSHESIAEAKKAIGNSSFDLALVDLHLEDGNGFELIEEINHTQESCKVVIISAYDSEEERVRAGKLKVGEFISKPFSRNELQEKLQTLGFNI